MRSLTPPSCASQLRQVRNHMTSNAFRPKPTTLFWLLAPATALFVVAVVAPVLISIGFSTLQWSGGRNMKFIGIGNLVHLVQDSVFWKSFGNNLFITIFCLIFQIGIGFLVASILQNKTVKFGELHRTVIFFPVVMSAVVIGFMWSMIYNREYGLLNTFLRGLGLSSLIHPYLDDPKTIMFFVSIPIVWQYIGLFMMLFLTGYQGIDTSIIEVSIIDGAGPVRRAWYVTLPLLSETFKVAVILCIAGNMKIFDHIFIMTGGGPGRSSNVMAMYAYNQAFEMFQIGYGSAVSVGIMILSLTLILASRLLIGRNQT